MAVKGISFSAALNWLKVGKRVARAGWNGKGMWLSLVRPDLREAHNFQSHVTRVHKDGNTVKKYPVSPWVGMKTADDKFVPWLCSQTDMLAEDWEIVE